MVSNIVRLYLLVVCGALAANCLWAFLNSLRRSGKLIVAGLGILAVAAGYSSIDRWGEAIRVQTVIAAVGYTVSLVGLYRWAVRYTIPDNADGRRG